MSDTFSSATRAVRAALETDSQHNAVVPPLHLTSTYAFKGFGEKGVYDYTRSGNPTRDALGDAIASLEGAEGAVITASGMAAVTLVTQLLNSDELLIAPHDCYGGTYRLLDSLARRGSLRVEFVDQTDDRALYAALAKKPKLLWLETPSNPLLRIVDIRRLAQKAHDVGALLLVDNTFLSPGWQLPIGLGADLVLHSTTKYLNGHSDVVGEQWSRARRRSASNCCGGRTHSVSRERRSTAISPCGECARCTRAWRCTNRMRRQSWPPCRRALR